MSRERETNTTSSTRYADWTGIDTEGDSTLHIHTPIYDTYHKKITDVQTPNYTALLASGDFLPVNPVEIITRTTSWVDLNAGSMTLKSPSGAPNQTVALSGELAGLYPTGVSLALPAFVPDSDLIDHVVIGAIAKAKEPDWDVLTFLGELHSTVDLFRNAIRRINRISSLVASKAARREARRSRRDKRPYSPSRALEDFGSLWLEARYGWRPLLMDIQNMMKALAHEANSGVMRKSVSKVVPLEGEVDGGPVDLSTVLFHRKNTRTGSARYRAVVFYRGNMSPFGFNPVVTAWELTKYSFVVDWVVDVGSWLQAITPRVGYTQLGISVSVAAHYVDTQLQTAEEGSGHLWDVDLTNLKYTEAVDKYVRWEYTDIPLPSIQVNLNKLKIIDLIFLALQGQKDVGRILRL